MSVESVGEQRRKVEALGVLMSAEELAAEEERIEVLGAK